MADLGELKIPAPMRAAAGTIIALTDEVCADGLIVDARELPPQLQAQAFELGIIPYIPALGRDGTTEWLRE